MKIRLLMPHRGSSGGDIEWMIGIGTRGGKDIVRIGDIEVGLRLLSEIGRGDIGADMRIMEVMIERGGILAGRDGMAMSEGRRDRAVAHQGTNAVLGAIVTVTVAVTVTAIIIGCRRATRHLPDGRDHRSDPGICSIRRIFAGMDTAVIPIADIHGRKNHHHGTLEGNRQAMNQIPWKVSSGHYRSEKDTRLSVLVDAAPTGQIPATSTRTSL